MTNILTRLTKQANFSSSWANKTFGNFDRSREPEAYDIAQRYVEKWQACQQRGIGLLFRSQVNGVGKTHLAWATLLEIIQRYPHHNLAGREYLISAQRWDVTYYLDQLHMSFYSHNGTVSKALSVELLILDDLGKEYSSEWIRTRLRMLFNTRYEQELPTICTSTASSLTLTSKLGADVVDRLLSRSQVAEFQSKESYRSLEGKEIMKEVGLYG